MIDVAIVGAGLMGRWHLAAARRAGARIVAVIDPDRDAARRLAARAPGSLATDDLSVVLQERKPRLVHVCSPVATHLPVGLALAAAGTHALIEKPLATNLDETRRLLAAAAQTGALVCPVHQYAFQAAVEHAARRRRELGRMRRLEIDISSAGADADPRIDRDELASEILPHPLSLIQRLAPDFHIESADWRVLSSAAGEVSAAAAQDGLAVEISISLGSRPTQFVTRLKCEAGTVEIDGFHGFATTLAGEVSRRSKVFSPFERSAKTALAASANLIGRGARGESAYPGLRDLVRRVYAAARGAEDWPMSAQSIIAGAAARDAITAQLLHRSAAHG